MGDTDRPHFSRQQEAVIEKAQNDVDQRYWEILRGFQAALSDDDSGRRRMSPPVPKRPIALQSTFADYAAHLFSVEASSYPNDLLLRTWLEALRERVNDRIADTVGNLEEQGASRGMSLTYHGVTGEELRSAVMEELDERIEKRLNPPEPRVAPAPPLELPGNRGPLPASARASSPLVGMIQEQANRTDKQQESPRTQKEAPAELQGEVARRATLLSEYKVATGASHKKIYEAKNSRIYKPEFYDWLRGELPSSSRTTQAFEAFLKAKRNPIPRKPTS